MERSESIRYGLSDTDVNVLLQNCLKPECFTSGGEERAKRIRELLHWFVRYYQGDANPKWLSRHASELAYYIATQMTHDDIDVDNIRQKGFIEGINITENERRVLTQIGAIKVTPTQEQE